LGDSDTAQEMSAHMADSKPVFSLDYRGLPIGSRCLSLDALLARQGLLARVLLAAAFGLGLASAFCDAASINGTVWTVVQLMGSSLDLGGRPTALLGRWLIAVASATFLLSPILVWIRSASRSHLIVTLGALPLLMWIGVPILFLNDRGWTWWNGLACIQVAMTLSSAAIILHPRREQKIAMIAMRPDFVFKLVVAAMGTAAGLFFAFAIASFLDVAMHSYLSPRDILRRLILVLAFFGLMVFGATMGCGFAMRRCAQDKYFVEEIYGSCAGLGLRRQAQGDFESRERIE
jgi:energy-converting hydrogenase Eha subunit C